MPPSLLDALLDGPFALIPGPDPIPGDLRLAWGVSLVVLLLGRSRSKKASLQKLHFMAHSVRTRQSRQEALHVFDGQLKPADFVVRVEPWLIRAIAFARGAGLIELHRGRSVILTQRGEKLLEQVSKEKSILAEEKVFLDAIGHRATEAAIDRIMRMELPR